MGWGEFEASIRIVWKDEAEERPVLLTHFIKLYPSNAPVASVDPSTYMNTTVPIVSEKYDEVVFTNPKVAFHKQLLDGQQQQHQQQQQQKKNKKRKKNQLPYPLSHESSVMEHFRTYGDEMDVKAMLAAREFLQKELRTVKDRLIKVDDELEEVKGMLVTAAAAAATSSSSAVASASNAGVTDGTTKSASAAASSTGKGGSSSKSSKKKKSSGGGGDQPASKKSKSS